MSTLYDLEVGFHPQDIAPQHEGLYRTQLSAMSEITLKGAGAILGLDSGVRQHFLKVPGASPEYLSSLLWPGPSEDPSVCFAVLPPQDFAHRYFGVVTPATRDGNKLWAEGVDLHPRGSRYGKLLISYDSTVEPEALMPIAVAAFIQQARQSERDGDDDNSLQSSLSLDPVTHRRLGTALLTFWNTLELPPRHATGKNHSRPNL